MRVFRPVLQIFSISVVTSLVAACAASASPSWTPPTVTPAPSGPAPSASVGSQPTSSGPVGSATPGASPSGAAGSPGGSTRIEVSLTDTLKIEPGTLTVPTGTPVTFVVSNTGALDHEFFVGDEQAQNARQQAMSGATTAPPDGPDVVGVRPGETKELTMTFSAPGSTLAGCHVAGHYLAGMKATITIQ